MLDEKIRQMWRLTEGGEDNLGLACTDDGLVLGRTPLIEQRDGRFVVREQREIERLLGRAYRSDVSANRLMSGLVTVASALNANDQCLARIAAVHLRIPDLPDRTARDDLEAEDNFIKSVDWNPALHPRTGTPPNPGWFESTGDEADESFPIRTAQNDDPTQRSDDSQSVGEYRVVLPPGQRNDELGDLLEWVANAEPKDEQAIRAEIKRRFYDTGDLTGGNALNAALSNVLGPSIQRKDRQKILEAIGPYSQSDEDDESIKFWIETAPLLLAIFPPAAGAEAASAAWELGWAARGIYISEQRGANLPALFPVVDKWLDGVATSIKSIDLRAATYQDATRLTYRLNDYINKLIFFDGASFGDYQIEASAINGRMLDLVLPKGNMTAAQRAAISAAKARAKAFDVELIVTPF
jgi:hypothetical protein